MAMGCGPPASRSRASDVARAFHRRARDGTILVGLEPDERRLLTMVFSSLLTLLAGDDAAETRSADDDPSTTDPSTSSEADVPSDAELAAMFGMDGSGEAPTDPALRRLFPDVDPKDQERSEEFRRYTEQGLRDAKIAGLRTVLLTLGRSDPIVLARTEAGAWLGALNDMRLVTAVRLGIETEEDWENLIGNGEPSDDMTVTIYDFLSWLQESLAIVLLEELA